MQCNHETKENFVLYKSISIIFPKKYSFTMFNNTLASTFRHIPSLGIRNVDLKCFSTLLQCAILKMKTMNGGTSNTAERKYIGRNIMVRLRVVIAIQTLLRMSMINYNRLSRVIYGNGDLGKKIPVR